MKFIEKLTFKQLMISFLILVGVFIILAIIMYFTNKDDTSSPTDATGNININNHDEHDSHEEHDSEYLVLEGGIESADKGILEINNHLFTNKILLNKQFDEKLKIDMKKANKEFIFILSQTGEALVYDLKNNKLLSIESGVNKIFPDEKNEFLFYTKLGDDNEGLFAYDLKNNSYKNQLFVTEYYGEIKNVIYNNGLIYIDYISKLTPEKPDLVTKVIHFSYNINENNTLLDQYKSEYYHDSLNNFSFLVDDKYNFYDFKNNSFNNISVINMKKDELYKLNFKISENESIKEIIKHKNNYSVISSDSENIFTYLYVNGNKILKEEFNGVSKVQWINENSLLVLNQVSLFVYDIKENTIEVISTDIFRFDFDKNSQTIYTLDNKFKLYKINYSSK